MKICVTMWSLQRAFYQNKIDVSDFIDLAGKWGVDAVELLDFFFKNEAEIDETIKVLNDRKLPVAAFSIENDFVVRFPEELDRQIEYVKESIDTAVRLKSPMLRMLGGYAKHDVPFEMAMDYIVRGLKACIPYAEEKGVVLVLENQGFYTGTSAKILDLMNKTSSEYLKVNMDTGNFLLELENPVNAVDNLKGLISYVHFKDIKKMNEPDGEYIIASSDFTLYRPVTAGEGDIDLKKIVEILSNNDYNGYVSVEYEGLGDCIQETEKSIGYLRSLI